MRAVDVFPEDLGSADEIAPGDRSWINSQQDAIACLKNLLLHGGSAAERSCSSPVFVDFLSRAEAAASRAGAGPPQLGGNASLMGRQIARLCPSAKVLCLWPDSSRLSSSLVL